MCSGRSKAEEFFGSDHQTQCKYGNHDFADGSHGERAKALFAHVAEIRTQADAGERKQKCPTRKIGERAYLILAEELIGGQHGDEQKTQDELREFLPEECGFVADRFGLPLAGPVDRVSEHDEADHGVACGFHEDGQFASGVRVQGAGGGCFGRVINRKAGPDAVSAVAQMQIVADQRKREERQRTESENGGDGEGRVFVVGINRAFCGDNGADAANGGTDGEQRG